ncbi:GNAT family N-acetyltransferase [Streptomyces sp. NPDC059398]|uniref:GNAT family N-acetyltransferase n=1 Tax=Streptomyces sp. NPDC059398 TaxID=3346820 RepID=UPI00368F46A8
MPTATRLRTGEEILTLADDHWTTALISPSWSGPAWTFAGAVAYGTGTPDEPDSAITVVGTPDAAAALVRTLLADREEPPYVITVPRETSLDVEPETEPEEWELMVVHEPPPAQPGEDRVTVVDDSRQEISALLAVASPDHSVRPGHPKTDRWMGIRDESGQLVSVGALLRQGGGRIPYLASIATLPTARGQGLGSAVSGALTRWALEQGADRCLLAHHSANTGAHHVYERLGFRTVLEFTSVQPDQW